MRQQVSDRMPCLVCGAWANYYRYDTMKRRWPEETTWRAAYCPTCRQDGPGNGTFTVLDHKGVLHLRSFRVKPEYRPMCKVCGEPYSKERAQHHDTCARCAGYYVVRIEIRQCPFDECIYGKDGEPAWFVNGSGSGRRLGTKYCTLECSRLHNKRLANQRRQERLRDPNARRETAKKGTRLRIAYLHGYKCSICRRLIDVSKPQGDPQSMEIDHIIPVSDGGTDKIGNLRPLHRACHQRREAEAQLGLDIG